MKISVNLKGGLGNQLFQIFAVIAYSIRYNFNYKLNKNEPKKTYWDNFLKHLNVTNNCCNYRKYQEKNFTYCELPYFYENTKLFGYFQSYKYFENEYEKIIDLIRLEDQQENIKKKYSLCNSISMHFRFGDYKYIQECHPLMPYEYYKSALLKMNSKDKIFYLCESEDNEIVDKIINLLSSEFSNDFIKISDSIEDWEQLLIMSCCNHNIIANSTFSWWGAYFNKNPYKKIYYPDNWFGPKINNNIIDLLPTNWQKIKL